MTVRPRPAGFLPACLFAALAACSGNLPAQGVAVLPATAPQAPANNAATGRLVPVGSSRLDLGEFRSDESRTARFELRNPGPGPVEIVSVSKSCGCADAEVERTVVPPEESVAITLRTIPRTLSGPFGKSFYVVTTAPGDARVVQLAFSGRVLDAASPPAPSTPPQRSAGGPPVSQEKTAHCLLPTAHLPLPAVTAEAFVQEGCAECKLLRSEFLPRVADRYGDRVRLLVSDTHDPAVFLRLLDVLDRQGVVANEPLYLVVDGRDVLAGWEAVRRDGFATLDARLASAGTNSLARVDAVSPAGPGLPPAAASIPNAAERYFTRFTPALVAAAGLADGLNPCAFTTIVFLTSLLAAGGRKGRAVFLGGLAFCLASFATYFLLGLGLLRALRGLEALAGLRQAVEWGTVALLGVLGALSLLDARRFALTGDADSVRLQLPESVKRRIRGFARDRWGGAAVFGTGLACGAGVTLLESVCTGQLYLPTLVFMSRGGGGLRARGLLLLYNAAFILPLFAVFLLGALGVRSQRLASWTRRNVVPSKLLLAAVFLTLATLLATRQGG